MDNQQYTQTIDKPTTMVLYSHSKETMIDIKKIGRLGKKSLRDCAPPESGEAKDTQKRGNIWTTNNAPNTLTTN